MKHGLVIFLFLIVALTLTFITQQQQTASAADDQLITDELRQALQQYGEIPVIISLEVPSHATLQDDTRRRHIQLPRTAYL